MGVSSLSFSEAVFLANLPYRKSFYIQGGWRKDKSPNHSDWRAFLNHFFLPKELALATKEAQKYTSPYKLRIGSQFRPVSFLSFWDEKFPIRLANIYDPPPILFYWGDHWFDYRKYMAVVGTRRVTSLCRVATEIFIKAIKEKAQGEIDEVICPSQTQKNICIVSGLALGVDGIAHRAAVQYGLGNIAVLGAGLEYAGPRCNLEIVYKALSEKSRAPFTLLTEFPPNQQARSYYFPRRNRIIAGLVESIFVMQAPEKSGALITARYGLEEGRDVLVFDHPLFDNQPGANDGGRALIEAGAEMIVLPELQKRIVHKSSSQKKERPVQLSLWKNQGKGLKWLGKNHYIEL